MSMRGVVDDVGRRLLTRGPIAGGIADRPPLGAFDEVCGADMVASLLMVVEFVVAGAAIVVPVGSICGAHTKRGGVAPPDDGSCSVMPGKRFSAALPMSDICIYNKIILNSISNPLLSQIG